MKPANNLLRYAVPGLILAACVVTALGNDPLGEARNVFTALAKISGETIFLVLTLSLVNYILRYWRWRSYVATSRVRVPEFDHFLIYIAGFAFTLTPGKVGETYRSAYLSNYGMMVHQSLGVFFAERLLDLFAILILSVGVFTLWSQGSKLVVGATMFIVGGAWLVLHPAAFHRLLTLLESYRPINRSETMSSVLKRVVAFIASSRGYVLERLPLMLSVSLVAWVVEGLGLWVLASEFKPEFGLILAIGIYAIAVLVGTLMFLPGGLGGTEAAMGTLLVGGGLTVSEAVVVTLVCRLATLWFAIALGVIALMLLHFRKVKSVRS